MLYHMVGSEALLDAFPCSGAELCGELSITQEPGDGGGDAASIRVGNQKACASTLDYFWHGAPRQSNDGEPISHRGEQRAAQRLSQGRKEEPIDGSIDLRDIVDKTREVYRRLHAKLASEAH
jgi:hypothetical protein